VYVYVNTKLIFKVLYFVVTLSMSLNSKVHTVVMVVMVAIVMKYCVVELEKYFLECTVSSKSMHLKMNKSGITSRSIKTEQPKYVASINRVFHGFVQMTVILL
jgi:hypothetical protein